MRPNISSGVVLEQYVIRNACHNALQGEMISIYTTHMAIWYKLVPDVIWACLYNKSWSWFGFAIYTRSSLDQLD